MKVPPDDWDDDERRALKEVEAELAQLSERHRDDPPFELLRAADAGALPESLHAPLAEHLKHSAWSRALVDGTAEPDISPDELLERRVLDRVRRSAPATPASGAVWRARAWFPALAAAAVLVVMVGLMRRGEPGRPGNQPPGSQPQTATPVTATPAAPVYVLALAAPDVKLTAQALVLRNNAGESQFVNDVAKPFNAYRAKDYREAERQFAALQTRYPKSVEVVFYRGISQLFLNDATGAIESLQAARRLDDETFTAETAWYLAVAYERASQPALALAELGALCRQTSPFTSGACDAAARLQSK